MDVPHSDDERLGRLLRTLRRRSALSQEQLSKLAGVPIKDIRRIETGFSGVVPFDRTRDLFAALGGKARISAWWNGAAADRLLDEAHARIVESAARVFVARGWRTLPEVTFSEYGERGSIDLLAADQSRLAVAVCEIKSAFGSLEDMNRSFDAKIRLIPKISQRVLGWSPTVVGRILIVPNESTIRRVVVRHAATMDAIYPGRGREVRAWLRRPTGDLGAIWFVSIRTGIAQDANV